MTKKAQEAYIRGFCKTAEAYGVDPRKLIKVAGLLKTLGIFAGIPMAAGAIGGKLSQETDGGRARNASIGALSGATALGGLTAYRMNGVLNEALKETMNIKAPMKLKILPMLIAAGLGGSIGTVGGGLAGALFGKKETPKSWIEELLASRR